MRRCSIALLLALVCAAALGSLAAAPASAQSPWWRISSTSRPSALQAGKTGVLVIVVENVGDVVADATREPLVIADTLPLGLRATGASAINEFLNEAAGVPCKLREAGAAVACTFSGAPSEVPDEQFEKYLGGLPPFQAIELRIPVDVSETASECEPHSLVCERNLVSVSGAAAPAASLSRPVVVGSPPSFGVADYELDPEEEGGTPDTQAGSHPFQVAFDLVFDQDLEEGEVGTPVPRPIVDPIALTKDLRLTLPPGFVGDPSAIPQCPASKFLHYVARPYGDECPADTAVGVVTLAYNLPAAIGYKTQDIPFFNLEPSVGEPARLGFYIPELQAGVYIDTALRTGSDYAVTSITSNISQAAAVASAKVTLWGVPGDARHNALRGWGCLETARGIPGSCAAFEASHPPPFFDLPTSCTGPLQTSVEADSWQDPGHFQTFASEPVPAMEGCDHLQFTPEIKVTPDATQASTPTGLDVDVHVPQEGQLNAQGLAQSNIRAIQVTLPAGVTLNPSAADGLQACTANTSSPLGGALGVPGNQVGYQGTRELEGEPGVSAPTFTPYKPESTDALAAGFSEPFQQGVNFCPDASKVATVTIKTPLLPNPVVGAVYLASPQNFNVFPPENPFSTHVAMYILAEDPVSGSLVKLPGRVELGGEPGASGELAPGQIRSFFEDNPQLPFEDAEVHFFGGERAPLATPDHCGTYTTQALYTPWDGGETVHSESSFQITSGPNGGPCPGSSLPFSPELRSGTSNINAGSFSNLSTTLSRPSGDQDIQSVTLHYPPGLSGILSGVELCSEAQANAGTCGPNSQIGETIVSVGVGGEPFTVVGGKAYITGPFNGTGSCNTPGSNGCAPFGLSIVNPAKAGPFDLQEGRPVVVRAKIEVNPTTAALTVTTDESGAHAIPTIIEGFPLQIQHVNVLVNRPGFTFNPTNCTPTKVTGEIKSAEGASSQIEDPFQVTNCASLKFTPKFSVSTSGKTSKADGASLDPKVTEPNEPQGSQANITKVKVELPRQLPSRLTTLQKACTNKQFEANPAGCPSASKIGYAVVHTPLLPVPLTGPAIFVSHGNEAFPSLTMVLQGYGVTVDLVGATYISPKGITSTTFKTVPDQPFSSFELTLPEEPYSALGTNYDLCALTHTVTVKKKVALERHGKVVKRNGKVVKVTKRTIKRVSESLQMPNELIGQNGAAIHEVTKIAVTGCPKPKAHKANKKHKAKKGKK